MERIENLKQLENQFRPEDDINFFKSVNCNKSIGNSFTDKFGNPKGKVLARIPTYKKIPGGIFSSSYIIYVVKTDPFGWVNLTFYLKNYLKQRK